VTLQKLNSKPLRREAAESFLPDGQSLDDSVDDYQDNQDEEE
jgi:ASC-1-like (ASCH) protein